MDKFEDALYKKLDEIRANPNLGDGKDVKTINPKNVEQPKTTIVRRDVFGAIIPQKDKSNG